MDYVTDLERTVKMAESIEGQHSFEELIKGIATEGPGVNCQ